MKLALQIKELIDQDPSGDHSLMRLAQEFAVSKSQLIQQFKARYNISIHQYLLQQRLQKARKLLKETDDPIKAIASSCGFKATKHFQTLFKKKFLITPHSFRKLYGEI